LEGVRRAWKRLEGLGRSKNGLEGVRRDWKELERLGRA